MRQIRNLTTGNIVTQYPKANFVTWSSDKKVISIYERKVQDFDQEEEGSDEYHYKGDGLIAVLLVPYGGVAIEVYEESKT